MLDLSGIWPKWTIEKVLGRGSYGTVYRAVRNDLVKTEAAIKVISVPGTAEERDSLRAEGCNEEQSRSYYKEIVDGFSQEIELLLQLRGLQNIVSIEEYEVVERSDEIGWDIYIRMELLTPLKSWLADKKLSDGSLTEDDVVRIGTDICNALEICEKNQIIHRDIKPENIFVNDNGDFKLGDFGVARRLENLNSGLSVQGSWPYMAPEVALNRDYDTRADLYSLGLILYQLLNGGKLPFLNTEKTINSPLERENALKKRLSGIPVPKPVFASPRMSKVITKACEYNPNRRFQTAYEMKKALSIKKNPIWPKLIVLFLGVTLLAAVIGGYNFLYDGIINPEPTGAPRVTSAVGTSEPEITPIEINMPDKIELNVGDVQTVPVRFKGSGVTGADSSVSDYQIASIIDQAKQWNEPDEYSFWHIRLSGNSPGEAKLSFYLLGDERTERSASIVVSEAPLLTVPPQAAGDDASIVPAFEDTETPASMISQAASTPKPTTATDVSSALTMTDNSLAGRLLDEEDISTEIYEIVRFESSQTKASSTLQNADNYRPENAADEDDATAWVEGAPGEGEGESIVLNFEKKESVELLSFRMGYSGNYMKYGRPRVLRISFSEGESFRQRFDDLNELQFVELSRTIRTDWIKLEIIDVYDGRFRDCAISGVTAYRQKGQ